MASTAGLRSDLLTALAGGLAPAGFQRSEQSFRKPWGEARLSVHVSFIKRAADFDSIMVEVRRVGFPFLERFGSLAEVGRVLDADEDEARLICPLSDRRAAVRTVIRELLGGAAR
jgi:hypothetical protein